MPAAPAVTPAPRHPARVAAGALAAVALATAAAGVGAGAVLLSSSHTATTAPTASSPTGPRAAVPPPAAPSSGAGASSGPLDASAIAQRVDPAVVDITTTLAGGGEAAGTGMVITSNGEVLTNNHVIDGATSISAQVAGTGPTYTASVVGYDRAADIALLALHGASGLTTISLGDTATVSVGDAVVALGNALGRGGTPAVAEGVVTALDQTITARSSATDGETLSGLVETDASIQPGDSGGPLVDTSGRVIGMDTAAEVARGFRRSTTATAGYAIPISAAMAVVRDIEAGGSGNADVQVGDRALLGVAAEDGATGATIADVQPDSPAAAAGLAAGDVIVSLDGRAVVSAASLEAAILAHRPGDRVTVTWVDAAGGRHAATVRLTSGPPA